MPISEPQETPFSASSSQPVDAWSRAIFDRLSNWSLAQEAGQWLWYEPGYLVLRIESANGEEIDPAVIDTGDGELTVVFGGWHTHLPEAGGTGDDDEDVTVAVVEAQALVAQWIKGWAMTAFFTGEGGVWCGTALLDPGEPIAQLGSEAERIRQFNPTKVELRSARRSDWRRFFVRNGQIEAIDG